MKVFKFGGVSLQNAEAIKNVAAIVSSNANGLLVVVSAIGKTTNALEKIILLGQAGKSFHSELNELKESHKKIIVGLLANPTLALEELTHSIDQIKREAASPGEYDFVYDQVIGYGEMISSKIVQHYFVQEKIKSEWIDSRRYIRTDSTFREGQVQWAETENNIALLLPLLKNKIAVTQGFIAANHKNETVSLGREGSDYTAAIFGSALKVESVTIWKDVPGVMSADPKRLPHALVFDELPYKETAEMTYYGASVIHPKTVKPLALRGIPLFVKSFVDPNLAGTKIHECHVNNLPPLIVHKENQCLISCKVTDYTFIDEAQLGLIFRAISESGMRINVMQNSAITFSFCVDYVENRVLKLIGLLSKNFEVFYNTGLMLITIKNYDQKTFDEYRNTKGVILEQSSRSALQVLVKRKP